MSGGLFNNGTGTGHVDFEALFDSGIPKLSAQLLRMGVLVAFGSTRDRGALSITITHDGAYDREYFRTSEDAEDYLRRAADALAGMGLGPNIEDRPSTPLATRRRQRLS